MNTTSSKKKSIVFTLRFTPELHQKLKERAEKEKRSIAKEVEYLIEKQIG